MTTIFHNPRCSKSREALRLIEEKGGEFEIVKYLEEPLDKGELQDLVSVLEIKPLELVRKQEKAWKAHYKGKELTDEQIIDAMVKFPKLIERPIVINGNRAAIGRPPEKVLEVL